MVSTRLLCSGGVVIPGMPPQSILDYERDVALYEYYKQKYERDWLRNGISPPSPFKRFINYNPKKSAPPPEPQVIRAVAPAHPHPHLNPAFTQPPPPGDATPTEEDAGLYAFRPPTPENFYMPPGPAPWDPPVYDGDLAERERIIREEEYYNEMQKKLHTGHIWPQPGHPADMQRDHRRAEPRIRDRQFDDRRRGRYSPPTDRGRSWGGNGDRHPSRQRRQERERSRSRRDSRDRGGDSRRGRESRDAWRESRKRPRVESESRSRPRGAKKERVSKRSPAPERKVSGEPYPPGEGDGTPVRDESRVEIRNESIKVKVINEKAKSRRGGKRRKSEDAPVESSRSERRVVEAQSEARPARERSPTPTLDEGLAFADNAPSPGVDASGREADRAREEREAQKNVRPKKGDSKDKVKAVGEGKTVKSATAPAEKSRYFEFVSCEFDHVAVPSPNPSLSR